MPVQVQQLLQSRRSDIGEKGASSIYACSWPISLGLLRKIENQTKSSEIKSHAHLSLSQLNHLFRPSAHLALTQSPDPPSQPILSEKVEFKINNLEELKLSKRERVSALNGLLFIVIRRSLSVLLESFLFSLSHWLITRIVCTKIRFHKKFEKAVFVWIRKFDSVN